MLNKVKTGDLKGAALDWAVGTALGRVPKYNMESHGHTWYGWWLAGEGYEYERLPSYSTNWAQGGPIIERECIGLKQWQGAWRAELEYLPDYDANYRYGKEHGPTPLIAAMRCYVASKFGDTLEIPSEVHDAKQ